MAKKSNTEVMGAPSAFELAYQELYQAKLDYRNGHINSEQYALALAHAKVEGSILGQGLKSEALGAKYGATMRKRLISKKLLSKNGTFEPVAPSVETLSCKANSGLFITREDCFKHLTEFSGDSNCKTCLQCKITKQLFNAKTKQAALSLHV
jgi:hypothetical protein